MKKRLVFIIVASLIFSLTGCRKKGETALNQVPVPVPAPTVPTTTNEIEATIPSTEVEILQKPLYAISLVPTVETITADDGTVIFKEIFQTPYLFLPEPGVANRILLDLGNRLDINKDSATAAATAAKQAYSNSNRNWVPHLIQVNYAPQRFDSGILSFYGKEISYSGGAHSTFYGQSVSYDLVTGESLSLVNILCDDVTTETLTTLIIDALEATKAEQQIFSGYETEVNDSMQTSLIGIKNWYFTKAGLCFWFNPNAIAPYSAGTVIAEIPYSKLIGILRDEYFPAEEDPINSEVSAVLFAEDIWDNYTQFSELILDSNGTTFLLFTDRAVTNIRIYAAAKGTLSLNSLDSGAIALGAYTLTPGDAIMVAVDFSANDLVISYQSGEDTITKPITFNGSNIIIG